MRDPELDPRLLGRSAPAARCRLVRGQNVDGAGGQLLDYSHAGYRGGGVPLPAIRVVSASEHIVAAPGAPGGCDSARIQAAIDSVSALRVSERGSPLRGGVYTLCSCASWSTQQLTTVTPRSL
eukprot:SAG22_NODE_870_length_6749_cov_2.083308_2_plen_123_part_00